MGAEHLIIHAVKAIKEAELFGDGPKAHELSNLIKQHSLLATASGMIPVPGLDLAALAANTWTMYVRINKVVGVSFGDNVLKSIASGVFANLAALIPGLAVAVGAGVVLKMIPGFGTLGGMAVEAAANVAVTFVAGKVYLKSLEQLVNSGKPLTDENIKAMADEISKDKTFVKQAYSEGKDVAKNS